MSKSRDLEKLATGPHPRLRVPIPERGERCPRCHSGDRDRACLLCRPDLVPAINVAACFRCGSAIGAACVERSASTEGMLIPVPVHRVRAIAAVRALALDDFAAFGAGYVRTRRDGSAEYIPFEEVTVIQHQEHPSNV